MDVSKPGTNTTTEFVCQECGHRVVLRTPAYLVRICRYCTALPGWYRNADLRRMFGIDDVPRGGDS